MRTRYLTERLTAEGARYKIATEAVLYRSAGVQALCLSNRPAGGPIIESRHFAHDGISSPEKNLACICIFSAKPSAGDGIFVIWMRRCR